MTLPQRPPSPARELIDLARSVVRHLLPKNVSVSVRIREVTVEIKAKLGGRRCCGGGCRHECPRRRRPGLVRKPLAAMAMIYLLAHVAGVEITLPMPPARPGISMNQDATAGATSRPISLAQA